MARLRAGVLGASGMIGQRFVQLLQDHPRFELAAAYASDRSAGRTLGEVWRLTDATLGADAAAMRLREGTLDALREDGVDVAFSALPSDVAGPLETAIARAGLPVFSNASAHRHDADAPLVVPEVNPEHLELLRRRRGYIVTNPNCTATGLTLVLHALRLRVPFRRVHVASYQALSGAGFDGPAGIEVAGNVLPHIPAEEEKLAAEPPRILGRLVGSRIEAAEITVVAHCARVPVRDGHLEAVTVEAEQEVSAAEVATALAGFRGLPQAKALPTAPREPILVRSEPDRPQPLADVWSGSPERARGMAVTVGRIRVDGRALRLFLLVNNTVRGGAGGSVLNAELAQALGHLEA